MAIGSRGSRWQNAWLAARARVRRRESATWTRAFRHHMHRWAAFAFVLGYVFLLSPRQASACACCSDSGYRSESRSALTKYERGMLGALRFASDPDLYSDDSEESVMGIDDYADALRLTVAENDGAFTFTFKDAKGVASKLVLARPKVVDRFVIDPRNDKDPKSNGPVLYK